MFARVNLLIDRLITKEYRDFTEVAKATNPDCTIASFDFLSAPASLLRSFKPSVKNLILLDSAWISLSPLIRETLRHAGDIETQLVIATLEPDDVFKIELAHFGFGDFVDCSIPTTEWICNLCNLANSKTGSQHFESITETSSYPTIPAFEPNWAWEDTAVDATDRQILRLLSLGMRDENIGQVVFTSTQSVKNRVSAMLSRSGLHNRTQLASMFNAVAVTEAVIRSSNSH
jgi:DNA-binding NarL/FixJ family response regulator